MFSARLVGFLFYVLPNILILNAKIPDQDTPGYPSIAYGSILSRAGQARAAICLQEANTANQPETG